MNIQKQVIAFFRSKMELNDKSEIQILNLPYLETGELDSLGVVEMIVQFEKDFNIRFTQEDFQAEKFKTIGGLIKLISTKTKE